MEAEAAAAVRRGYDEGYAEGLARAAAVAAGMKEEEAQRVAGRSRRSLVPWRQPRRANAPCAPEIEAAAPKLAFALLETLLWSGIGAGRHPGPRRHYPGAGP